MFGQAVLGIRGDGTLDLGFGNGGIVMLGSPHSSRPFGDGSDIRPLVRANASYAVIDAAGRLLVLGSTGPWLERDTHLLLSRVTPDGKLDRSFGEEGTVDLSALLNSSYSWASFVSSMACAGDKPLLSIQMNKVAFSLLARLNEDGSPDRSFGGTGAIAASEVRMSTDYFSSIATDRDHQTYVSFSANGIREDGYPGFPSYGLYRLSADGLIDESWMWSGGAGLWPRSDSNSYNDLAAPAQLSCVPKHGELMVGGGVRVQHSLSGARHHSSLEALDWRLGRYDESPLAPAAKIRAPAIYAFGESRRATPYSENHYVHLWTEEGANPNVAIPTFSQFESTGAVSGQFFDAQTLGGRLGEFGGMLIDSRGRVVTFGCFRTYKPGYSAGYFVKRHHQSCTPDVTFGGPGGGGVVKLEGVAARMNDACLTPDDSLILVGSDWGASSSLRLYRLDADGNRDTTFEEAGADLGGELGRQIGAAPISVRPRTGQGAYVACQLEEVS